MSEGMEAVRRPAFKLPAPLNTSEDLTERSVWSPNRPSSSIVATGAHSPRTTPPPGSLLATQVSQGSSLNSPKTATPTKFDDPLLSMPSFRKSGSSSLDPVFASPLTASPSFKAGLASSSSFSARRIGIDFRRSVPGGLASPGDVLATTRGVTPRHHSLSRGTSDFGDFGPITSPLAGSESGGQDAGVDDNDAADQDVDVALDLVGRHHSTIIPRNGPSPSATGSPSPATSRYSMRASEDDEFMKRLQQNRNNWRERSRTGSFGPSALSGGGSITAGLQNKTHAALQQLRGELKSLSMRSIQGTASVPVPAMPSGGGAAASPAPAGGGTASGASAEVGGGVGYPPGFPSASAMPQWGAAGSGGGSSGQGRHSESHVQMSPSRLSISHHYSGGGGVMEHAPRQSSPLRAKASAEVR